MEKRFNIRVYGIWIEKEEVLINEEIIGGRRIIKFPGGGLEWGEGATDCLIREWKEELGIDIKVLGHFYTTGFFQLSAFDDSQVISIYYLVAVQQPETLTNYAGNERSFWMDIKDVSEETFTLAIDKKVGAMLHGINNIKKV
jgi:8-oxo-dGTP diphosphatase